MIFYLSHGKVKGQKKLDLFKECHWGWTIGYVDLASQDSMESSFQLHEQRDTDTEHKIWEKIPLKNAEYNHFFINMIQKIQFFIWTQSTLNSQIRSRYVCYLQPISQAQKEKKKKKKSWKHVPYSILWKPLFFLYVSMYCMKIF